jgi:hypothetical protein
MRNRNSIPPQWHLLPTEPNDNKSLRRWNTVVIVILGLLVLSVLLAAVGADLENKGSAASKVPLICETMVTKIQWRLGVVHSFAERPHRTFPGTSAA